MKNHLLIFVLLLTSQLLMAQSTSITPGTQGNIQLPRLSYDQILAIPNPQAGMMAFDSTFKCLKYYNGTKWLCSSQTEGDGKLAGFAWQKKNPSTLVPDFVTSIVTDSDNNIYIAGFLRDYYSNPYIAKYSPNGTLIWEHKDSNYNGTGIVALAVDNNQNVYAATGLSTNGGAYRYITIFKFNNNGTIAWTKSTVGETGTGSIKTPKGIFLDNNQNVYVTGEYGGTMTIDPLTTTANTSTDCFVLKLSNSGSPLWVKGTTNNGKIKVNTLGESYFAGYFSGSVNIDENTLTSAGNDDIIVCKYTNNGALAWIKQAGGSGQDRAIDLAIGNTGEVYAVGSFSGEAAFDGNTATSTGSTDFFVLKYTQSGVFEWVRNGGGTGEEQGVSIEMSPDNAPITLVSTNSNSVDFYAGSPISLAIGQNNFFVRYDPVGAGVKMVKAIESIDGFKINSLGDIYTWKNLGQYTAVNNPPYPGGYNNTFSKFTRYGAFVYKQVNQGTIASLAFGSDNHLFFTGLFVDTVQIGTKKLVCTDLQGDIYVSHWVE